eukprot:CAMPEP_0181401130 /NCGR_PEP_ID=MMETSP1110-20121109/2488_1 /TAXON_ID=174948 /ORGANISM="Symbiodinium sp., Strain CCMP421" /LENGTH=235 /DNA_ID=CAMNT_0023523283 /DNA_START=680 /DNA_END=1387 /DNA_ORIENTATION=-
MALPVAVPPTEEAQEEELDSDEASPGVDQLHTKQREQVVKGMVRYAFERQYQAASIEVSTVMLLEASYAWSIETSGAAITVVSLTSLLLAAFSAMLMSRRLVSESVLFFAANLIALLGVVFLFDFGTGAAGLLLADGLVYGCGSVSNGIAEGWGSKAAVPGTDFSQEEYRAAISSAATVARFLAPMIARTMLDFGGRNVYACMLLAMVALACATVHSATTMVWNLQREKAETLSA